MSRFVNRWPRALVYALVVALVPVMAVFGTPEQAKAAEVTTVAVGPTDKASADWSGVPYSGSSAACNFTGYQRLSSVKVHTLRLRIRCNWGPFWEYDDSFRFEGYGDGPDCRYVMPSTFKFTEDTDTDYALAPVTLQAAGGGMLSKDCNITNWRLILAEDGLCGTDNSFPDDGICGSQVKEGSWALGQAPQVTTTEYNGQCPYGTVSSAPSATSSVRLATSADAQAGSATTMQIDADNYYRFGDIGSMTFTWRDDAPANKTGAIFTMTPVYKFPSGSYTTYTADNENTKSFVAGYNVGRARSPYPQVPDSRMTFSAHMGYKDNVSENSRGRTIVGVIYNVVYPGQPYQPEGANDVASCRWNFGEKGLVPDDPNSTIDDPTAPLKDPAGGGGGGPTVEDPDVAPDAPTAEDDDCGFSFKDPTTWAGAAFCQLVKLLKAVVNVLGDILAALGGLVGAIAGAIADALAGIVGGILDGLKALFVPSTVHFTDSIDGVRDAWGDTAPGQVVKTYTRVQNRLTAPSSLGCAGPTMALDLPLTDSAVRLNLFSTCNPNIAKLANIARISLLVGIYIAALFVAMRIIAAAFGLRVDVGGDD